MKIKHLFALAASSLLALSLVGCSKADKYEVQRAAFQNCINKANLHKTGANDVKEQYEVRYNPKGIVVANVIVAHIPMIGDVLKTVSIYDVSNAQYMDAWNADKIYSFEDLKGPHRDNAAIMTQCFRATYPGQ